MIIFLFLHLTSLATILACTLPIASAKLNYLQFQINHTLFMLLFFPPLFFLVLRTVSFLSNIKYMVRALGHFPCFNNLMHLPFIYLPVATISVYYNVKSVDSRVILVKVNAGLTTNQFQNFGSYYSSWNLGVSFVKCR